MLSNNATIASSALSSLSLDRVCPSLILSSSRSELIFIDNLFNYFLNNFFFNNFFYDFLYNFLDYLFLVHHLFMDLFDDFNNLGVVRS